MASNSTWVRRALDIAKLPRVQLNNIQDLPGAKKKVNWIKVISPCVKPSLLHDLRLGHSRRTWPRIWERKDLWAWSQGSGSEKQEKSKDWIRRWTDTVLPPSTKAWLQE